MPLWRTANAWVRGLETELNSSADRAGKEAGPANPDARDERWYRAVPRDKWFLIGARGARSLGQGALVVDFALYLHALGWNAVGIGTVLAATLIVAAALTLLVGPASDRFGRKVFILCFEASQGITALIALSTSATVPLVAAAVIGGFGRGINGAAGPFAPVEQAWLAQGVAPELRGRLYSVNAAVGFCGMGLGALAAALPAYFARWLPGPLAYRPLFLVVFVGSMICWVLIALTKDYKNEPQSSTAAPVPTQTIREENRLLAALAGINAINGLAIGMLGPLMAYWFYIRFHEGPGAIGPMMAVALFFTALSALGTGWLTSRLGVVRAVVWMRFVGLACLFVLPFAPTYGIAAVVYILRSLFNRGTAGARQALSISLVRPSRRGLAASLGSASLQIPRAVGPMLAGMFFDAGFLVAPFLIAGALQTLYLVLFRKSFLAYDPSRVPTASDAEPHA